MSFASDFYKHCRESRLAGAQVSVFSGADYQLDLAYGMASLEDGKSVTLSTIFRIASISKIVVAVAVLQLVEKRLVSLDDDIGDILGFKIRNPRYPDDKITIKMLMTQTSSITDGPDEGRAGYNNVNGTSLPVTLRELLAPNPGEYYTEATWSPNRPGEKFIYSNFGCGILACVVEKATGEYFTDYVKRNVLDPLGVDASFRADEIINKEAIADLYYADNAGRLRRSRSGASFVESVYPRFPLGENYRGPAGGLFISMRDLARFARILIDDGAYFGRRILNKETVDLMLQIHWHGADKSYQAKGLQLKFINQFGPTFKGHTGSAYGAISYLFVNREEKLGICFITNGGLYRRGKKMYDVQENIFRSFLRAYWPRRPREHVFSADLRKPYGTLNDRAIFFSAPPRIAGDDVFLPVANIADIFDIAPETADVGTILRFRSRRVIATEPRLSLRKVCAAFKARYRRRGDEIEVYY
jgi:CubicO group peptidase (beta-lactamase class C family)